MKRKVKLILCLSFIILGLSACSVSDLEYYTNTDNIKNSIKSEIKRESKETINNIIDDVVDSVIE